MLSSFFLLFLAVSKHADNSQVYCNIFDNHSDRPPWKISELVERNSKVENTRPNSNREIWKSALRKQVDCSMVVPTKAQRYCENSCFVFSSVGSCAQVTSQHCPWHLDIQFSWPDFPYIERTLLYEVIQSPTSQVPYYVGRVRCMPNIQCQASRIEELEQNLLTEYTIYLMKLLQDKEMMEIYRIQKPKQIPYLEPVPWNYREFLAGK